MLSIIQQHCRLTKLVLALLTACLVVLSLGSCVPVKNGNTFPAPAKNHNDSLHLQNTITESNFTLIQVTPESGEVLEDLQEEAENEQFFLIEEVVIALLFIASLVGIVAQRFRVPYTIGLVLMGLVLALSGPTEIEIIPNLILALLVPPLIFEAAFHIDFNELRDNFFPIVVLAVPGVVLTMIIVGAIVSWGTGLPLIIALVFGALVSATDPVSVVALFRSIGVPRRLQLLLEGESLFNDGTAIVLFNIIIAVALAGVKSFNIIIGVTDFIRVAGGGLVVGLVLGTMVSHLIGRINDHLIETTLTSVLAFGSYIIGEILGVSGVLAVVAAGLVSGNVGPKGMSPTTRIVVFNFWEYAAFLANSFVFLLIGLRIKLENLFDNWVLILWAIMAVMVARAVSIYLLGNLRRDIPVRWQHVLYWGGLRGAIVLALALILPDELGPARDQIQIMSFGVVLFTLLFNGITMLPLVRRLNLVERSETQTEYEKRHARAVAARVATEYLEHMNEQGMISDHSWQTLEPLLGEHNQALVEAVREVMTAAPDVEAEELDTARKEYLRAQRSTLVSLYKDNVITKESYEELVAEVDAAIEDGQTSWPELFMKQEYRKPINRLITAVIQEQDVENAISALTKLGISLTRLPSTGGFLGRRNATLLIGLHAGQESAVIYALSKSCRRRVEYVATPLEGSPLPFPSPTPITVGGATIFTFEVERYEEI